MLSLRNFFKAAQRTSIVGYQLSYYFSSAPYKKLGEELIFTEACLDKIATKKKGAVDRMLRISVEGAAGCSGYSYEFKFDTNIQEDDLVLERDNTKYAVIDESSLHFLKGAVIDYEETMVKSAFVVQENPNAEKSCSCKVSFAPKESLF